ncbi:hypothetical protein [Streptomyces sp. DASNCL29]|uniref:hypothetical protein n=1 Tax=Streptomyces sp. DASNCL29 TaxID=2583819 RepID=UPI00110FCCB7|nr:hypothetical protein [Streptomyces sp. DASNCL29]TMU98072.1 hypothetical protein FGK60_09570 [Streptomyces sp. DASNCL29]
MTTQRPTQAAVLDAGLHWLYETGQPDNAHAQHHGEMIAADGNRTYRFIPVGAENLPVVVMDVAKVEYKPGADGDMVPANPLEPGELEALAAELERRGFTVRSTWNGHPAISGTVGLARPAHPGQVAAVKRYHAGCQQHPRRRVFCDCEAWRAGFRRVVRPVVEAAASAAGEQRPTA